MTVKKKEIAPIQKENQEISINDLKAQAYDQIAQMETHQRAIQQCQQNIQKINEEIVKKTQEAMKAAK